MQFFQVVIGNPPYSTGEGNCRRSLYPSFIRQAIALAPQLVTMIIPSRWFSGGKGLDAFRRDMLNDERFEQLVEYQDSSAVFPEADIAGGVCYFLWNKNHGGLCTVTTTSKADSITSQRQLNELDVFVSDERLMAIIRKVRNYGYPAFSQLVQFTNPFGLNTNYRPQAPGGLTLVSLRGLESIDELEVQRGHGLVAEWKVMVSKASSDHGGKPDQRGLRKVLARIDVLPPQYVCTHTYLVLGPLASEDEARNVVDFLKTKFCRVLIMAYASTQNISKQCFRFVPMMDMTRRWKDDELYEHFELTKDEISFVETRIRAIPHILPS